MRPLLSRSSLRLASVRLAFLALAAWLAAITSDAHAQGAFESSAPQALLIDVGTGSVLYEKSADEPVIPASMTKLMTIELLFEEIAQGRLKLSDAMTASENAWRTGGAPSGGSAMMLVPNARPSIEDLVRGLIVVSGNDAAITVAEGLAGTEAAFAERMNARAAELGLSGTRYRNATGFDADGQVTTARDLARLATHVVTQHTDLYRYFGEKEYTWNKTRQANRNSLLFVDGLGADGLKTGFLEKSGYGLVGSAKQGDRRLVVVVHGLKNARDRGTEAAKLLEWGFRSFDQRELFKAGSTIGLVAVHGGARSQAAVGSNEPLRLLLPRGDLKDLTIEIRYRGPVPAPVVKGAGIARLVVRRGDTILSETPLVALEDVPLGSVTQRAMDAAWALTLQGVRSLFSSLKPAG
jgi:serine-type D-Ala-D-Ala carboxypeptidase (penicillin-binding protein 5/6)